MRNHISIKNAAIDAIKALPEDCTLEEIINEIRSIGSLVKSFLDVDQGQFLTMEELIFKMKMDKQ